MKNGKRKLKRFQAGVWFPHATGAEWDEHIGRRARILKAIAEEQRQSDVQARELMFEASQECKQPLQNVFHRISCARINRRNRRNRPCMET
jgi:hypothetical protein